MTDGIRRSIERAVMGAELKMYPFPHLVAADALPWQVYIYLLRTDPFAVSSGDPWLTQEAGAKLRTGTQYHLRRQHALPASGSWSALHAALMADRWFAELLRRKFPQYFAVRFGPVSDLMSKLEHSVFLQQHDAGYSIGPHTDIPRRVVTAILSLAPPEAGFDWASCGTLLCAPVDPMHRCWGNNHYTMDGFRVASVAPYAANSLLVFYKTRHSFHAVAELPEGVPGRRFGLQYQVYEPKGGLFTDLSEPDIMETRHAK